MSSEMGKFFEDRGFGLKLGYGDRPALLVIDFVQAFTDPENPLGADVSVQMAQTRRLLEAARRAAVSVYYTSVAYEGQDMNDAGIWAKKMSGLATLRAGTSEVEVDQSLGRLPDEPVITKKYASSFFGFLDAPYLP